MNRDLLASIVFAAGGFVFFILNVPAYEAIADAKAVLQSRQDLLVERFQLVENVKELSRQYETRKNDIGKLVVLLPQKTQLDQVISAIYTAANQNGIQLREITTSAENANLAASYRQLFIKVSSLGDYLSMLGWLRDLEQSLRIYDVSEITVSRDNVVPGKFNLEFKFNAYNALK